MATVQKIEPKTLGPISLSGTFPRNVYQKPVSSLCGYRVLRSLNWPEISRKDSFQPCPRDNEPVKTCRLWPFCNCFVLGSCRAHASCWWMRQARNGRAWTKLSGRIPFLFRACSTKLPIDNQQPVCFGPRLHVNAPKKCSSSHRKC